MKTLEFTSNAWIGLTDSAQEGNWRWNNGDNVLVTDWGYNQPNGGVLENCTVINISDAYRWHDLPCSLANDYVCEKGKVTLTPTMLKDQDMSYWASIVVLELISLHLYTLNKD